MVNDEIIIRCVEKTSKTSPNVIAVVSYIPSDTSKIPGRCYVSEDYLDEAYGSVDGAAKIFVNRLKIMPRVNEFFVVAFAYGSIVKEGSFSQDIFWYPLEWSRVKNNGDNKERSIGFLSKNGIQERVIRDKGDSFILLGNEILHRRSSNNLGEFIRNFPDIPLLRYIN